MNTAPEHVAEDRMIDLLNGLLTEEESRGAFAHMKSCAECESRFAWLARHHETLEARGIPAELTGHRGLATSNATRRSRRWRLAGAVGLAVLAAVVAWVVVMPSGDERAATHPAAYWMPTTDDLRTVRARIDDVELEQLAHGIEAYRNRDLESAISILNSVQFGKLENEFDLIRRLYLASATVNAGLYQQAMDAIEPKKIEHYPHPWRQRVRWVLYLAVRGAGESDRADELLELLADTEGEIGRLARAERERLNQEP